MQQVLATKRESSSTNTGGSVSIDSAITNSIRYTNAELKVGYWTDGKPIYRRVAKLDSTVSGSSNTWIDTHVSSEGVQNLLSARLVRDGTDKGVDNYIAALAHYNNANTFYILDYRNPVYGSDKVTGYLVIFEYTKTTD